MKIQNTALTVSLIWIPLLSLSVLACGESASTLATAPNTEVSLLEEETSEGVKYNGAETLILVSVVPNLDRCGADPNTFEAQFTGEGIDTAGGSFTVVSSGCQNIAIGEVFDLTAVDTYATGDSVTIAAPEPFFLVFNPETCVSANLEPVKYKIVSGTGAFANAKGGGRFDLISNDPNCNGETVPSFVSFRGRIR